MDFPEAREGLRELIAKYKRTKWVKKLENSRESHKLANALGYDLEKEDISVSCREGGKANYFIAEIKGLKVCVSVFASHEQFWQKPSAGFLSIVRKTMARDPTCRWGVALLTVPDGNGVWIEGAEYEKTFECKWPEKLNEFYVGQAVEKKVARKFSNTVDLINVIRKWSDPGHRLYRRE